MPTTKGKQAPPPKSKLSKGQKKKAKQRAKARAHFDSGIGPAGPAPSSSSTSKNSSNKLQSKKSTNKRCRFTNNSKKSDAEFLITCYQVRLDQDYALNGNMRGLYDKIANQDQEDTTLNIIADFLQFNLLAHKKNCLPAALEWAKYLELAAENLTYACEREDAVKEYGRGPTHDMIILATHIYGSPIRVEAFSTISSTANSELC